MFRIIKWLFPLAVLSFISLILFAYLGPFFWRIIRAYANVDNGAGDSE